jgi:hypothetical protein
LLVLAVLISVFFIYKKPFSHARLLPIQGSATTDSIKTKDKNSSFPNLNKGEEENYLNTITTVDANGVKYKLFLIGDRRPKFYVNEKLITGVTLEKYTLLIDKLCKELWSRQSKSESSVK